MLNSLEPCYRLLKRLKALWPNQYVKLERFSLIRVAIFQTFAENLSHSWMFWMSFLSKNLVGHVSKFRPKHASCF